MITPVVASLAAAAVVVTGPARSPVLTVKMLADRASAAALAGPDVAPGQWVYRKIKEQDSAQSVRTQAEWTTADGTKLSMAGVTGTAHPVVSYAQLDSLPSDPVALISYLEALDKPGPDATAAESRVAAFGDIVMMLTLQVLPAKLTAELYQALADIPTVRVQNNVTDIAGRSGVAFVLPQTPQSATWELILDPADYRLLAQASWGGSDTPPNSPVPFTEEAILQTAFVSGPGVYPPGSASPSRQSDNVVTGLPGTSFSKAPAQPGSR